MTRTTGHAFYLSAADNAAHADSIELEIAATDVQVFSLGTLRAGTLNDRNKQLPIYQKNDYWMHNGGKADERIEHDSASGEAIIRLNMDVVPSANNMIVFCHIKIGETIIATQGQTLGRRTLNIANKVGFIFPVWFDDITKQQGFTIEVGIESANDGDTVDIFNQSISVHQYSN